MPAPCLKGVSWNSVHLAGLMCSVHMPGLTQGASRVSTTQVRAASLCPAAWPKQAHRKPKYSVLIHKCSVLSGCAAPACMRRGCLGACSRGQCQKRNSVFVCRQLLAGSTAALQWCTSACSRCYKQPPPALWRRSKCGRRSTTWQRPAPMSCTALKSRACWRVNPAAAGRPLAQAARCRQCKLHAYFATL